MDVVLKITPVADKQVPMIQRLVDEFVAGLPARISLAGCTVTYPTVEAKQRAKDPKPAAKGAKK